MNHHESPPAKQSIEEAPKVELKALPPHLRYVFLGKVDILVVIIASDLNVNLVESFVEVLKRFKRDILCTMANNIGIPLGICSKKNPTHA